MYENMEVVHGGSGNVKEVDLEDLKMYDVFMENVDVENMDLEDLDLDDAEQVLDMQNVQVDLAHT